MTWTPRPRPEWVTEFNAFTACTGDPANIVDLAAGSLIDAATAVTGHDDFGGDSWRAPFEVLLASLTDEAQLHGLGRVMARSELVRALANRLRITQYHREQPELGERAIVAPVLVTGTGRSGTSLLLELMACDPHRRAPKTWEMLSPTLDRREATAARLCAEAHREVTYWNLVTPEYQTMHDNGGDHPNECIFMTQPTFVSDHWMGSYPVPSYGRWLARADRHDSFAFHKRFLQVLQSDAATSWLLKAPSHLSQLRTFFDTYPDARIVITHRDPLQVLGSITDLMATLQWQKSDHVDYDSIVRQVAGGTAVVFDLLSQWRRDGTLPDRQIVDVRYCDLIADPIATVRSTYAALGCELHDAAVQNMEVYLDARRLRRAGLGAHHYAFSDTSLDYAHTRERFADYMREFDLPEEVHA